MKGKMANYDPREIIEFAKEWGGYLTITALETKYKWTRIMCYSILDHMEDSGIIEFDGYVRKDSETAEPRYRVTADALQRDLRERMHILEPISEGEVFRKIDQKSN